MASSNAILNSVIEGLGHVVGHELARQAWRTDNSIRAAQIDQYRRYVDGDYPQYLTDDARKQLGGTEYGVNYCDTVVQTMSDRLRVEGITANDEAADAWLAGLLRQVRFDGMQIDVHDATLRDGNTYLHVYWDRERQRVNWSHELAFDGIEGMLVIHDRTDTDSIQCAIKVWQTTRNQFADTLRINVYFADRIEKYISENLIASAAKPYYDEDDPATVYRDPATGREFIPWTTTGTPTGDPLGVPFVQFANRKRGNSAYGLSELASVMSLQDALNRTLNSMVMTAEMMAFPIRYSVGFKMPSTVQPGTVISVYAKDSAGTPSQPTEPQVEWLKTVRFGQYDPADLEPLLAQSNYLIDQIRTTTRTPSPEAVASTASGEARKQAEIGLVGKCRRFQVKAGNAWEDAVRLSARVQNAYGSGAPSDDVVWSARWASPELRDTTAIVANVLALKDYLTDDAILRLTSEATGLDDNQVQTIIDARRGAQTEALALLGRVGVNRIAG